MNLPTLRQLRLFVALAEHLHFGRAAAAANVTQSTLSASLKELEDTLRVVLVERTRRRITLTPLGEEIVTRARAVLRDAEDIVELAAASGAPLSGRLRLGAIPTVSPYLLPRLLPALRHAYPRLMLYLIEDLTARLLDRLENGTLDVLLLALPCDCNGEIYPLGRDPFQVVFRREHPLSRLKEVPGAEIHGQPLLLLTDGHCLRGHALAACELASARISEGFAATSLTTLVQMADNGLGVTLVPQMAIDAGIIEGTELVARPLAGSAAHRDLGLVWRRGTARRAELVLLGEEMRRLMEAIPGRFKTRAPAGRSGPPPS